MPDPERDIRDIPLSQLELSPGNVRKTPADASAFTELKASIAAHGLLENLIAHSIGPGTDSVTRYAVIAGGRRLAAMQALAAEGVLDEDHPVPCSMIGSIVAAEEVSLAENSVRAAMHPADQVEAFRRLADAGSTAAAIAARFGVSERTVEKRLRLGNAAPVLLEAYRAGEIDLETLMAFAITTDQARQTAVWETVSQQGYRPGAWQIKRLLTEDRVPATSAITRFVGIEAYEAAGGRIDRDLFAEEDERGIWFDDPDLLNKLAMDSLQVAARELKTRWKWAEARLDMDWSATAAFGRVRPQPAEPTDGEKAKIERLQTRNDELANMDDDGWTEELVEEAESNETRLHEIEATIEARAVYRREDIAIAGCIVTIGNDGELKLIQGLVRPEDMIDIDLGGGVIKQRIARKGGGRSGGFRTIGCSAGARAVLWRRTVSERSRDSLFGGATVEFCFSAGDVLTAGERGTLKCWSSRWRRDPISPSPALLIALHRRYPLYPTEYINRYTLNRILT